MIETNKVNEKVINGVYDHTKKCLRTNESGNYLLCQMKLFKNSLSNRAMLLFFTEQREKHLFSLQISNVGTSLEFVFRVKTSPMHL